MNPKININGINNFIKIKNKKYCLNIITFQNNNHICDSNTENYDINSYLVNKLKNTDTKYNFFLPNFQELYENKKYNYYNEILKIQNNELLLENVSFINYNYDLSQYVQLENFLNVYTDTFYFQINTTNILINTLKEVIIELNHILNIKNTIPKNINKTTKIILEYIHINYFKNKITILIHNIIELIEYCEANLQKLLLKIFRTDEYYNVIKNIYKMKNKICTNIAYILNFINVYDIIKYIFSSNNNNNILFLSTNISNLLIYFLTSNLSFEIEFIHYSDKIIDNNNIISINKVIKNINILNESSIEFLKNYLTNPTNCVLINEDEIL